MSTPSVPRAALLIVAFALAALAAAVHVYIWWLESVAWTTPAGRKVFRTSQEEAETTRFLAFNQGYDNLALAILVLLGIVIELAVAPQVGLTLVVAGTAIMLFAALVLASASPAHRQAALHQGAFPAPTLAAIAVHGAL